MRFNRIGLMMGAAALALVLGACGEPLTPGDGSCTSDSACQTGEICHPTAKICVQTCNAGADCPDSAKNCAALTTTSSTDAGTSDAGTSSGVKICQCATSVLCNSGNAGGSLVCNSESKVCEVKCSDNSGCSNGRECDTTTGECKVKASTTCSPACGSDQACDTATKTCVAKCTTGGCTGTNVCNNTTGLCEAPKTCTASNAQPDACSYGQFCNSGTCADVAKPTCVNFDPTQGGKQPVWSSATSTGPVIFQVTTDTPDNAFCTAPDVAFTTKVKAYHPSGTFPAQLSGVQGFFYVKVNGTQLDATASMRPQSGYTVSQNGKEAEFKVTLCAAASNSISAGFYFTNGNETCATITR